MLVGGGLERQYRVMLRFRPTLLSYCSLWLSTELLQPLLFEPLQSTNLRMSKSSIWGFTRVPLLSLALGKLLLFWSG